MMHELAKFRLHIHEPLRLDHHVHIPEGCMPGISQPCSQVSQCRMFKNTWCIGTLVTHTDHTDCECTVKTVACNEDFGAQ